MKKIYITPLTETISTVITDIMAGSGPSAEIQDPTIGGKNSRELYDTFWDEEDE